MRPLRYAELISAAAPPTDAATPSRTGVGEPVVVELDRPRAQRFVGTLANTRRSRWVTASRRAFLRGTLAAAGASAAAAATSLGPARVATAQGAGGLRQTDRYPYRIISGCDASFADHNCRPGCGTQPVCHGDRCCDEQGWFRNEPLSGYKPLPGATCGVAGETFQSGDGWLWEYRPSPTGLANDDPCRHCTRLVFRCHDGMVFDASIGVWQPQICRAEVECDPSGLPRASTPDAAQFANVASGGIDGATDDTNGRLSVWGWTHIEWFTTPVEWRIEVDDVVVAQGLADLPRPDIEAGRDTTGCCHGFSTQISGLEAGTHRVVLLAGYTDLWTAVSELTIVVAESSGPGTDPGPAPQVILPAAVTTPSAHAPVGGLDVLRRSDRGGAFASGWAADLEAGDGVLVVASVEGREVALTSPRLDRQPSEDLYPARHIPVSTAGRPELGTPGWTLPIPFERGGSQQVCVSVVDPTSGERTLLGCRTIDAEASTVSIPIDIETAAEATQVSAPPVVLDADAMPIMGAVDRATSMHGASGSGVELRGWCSGVAQPTLEVTLNPGGSGQPSARTGTLGVEAVVSGLGSATAAVSGKAVGFDGWAGEAEGFVVVLDLPPGRHQIQVYGLDGNGRRGGFLGLINHVVAPA